MARLGVGHPGGRLCASQPVEEQQRHGNHQNAARRAVEETQRAIERADPGIDDPVGQLHGDDGNDDQRDDEDDAGGGRHGDLLVVDVRREVRQDRLVEENAAPAAAQEMTDRISREKPRTMASIADTRVKPTRIPSSSVIGMSFAPLHQPRQSCSSTRLRREPAMRATRSASSVGWKAPAPIPPDPLAPTKFLAAQGQHRASKTQLFGFLEALLRMRNRPHCAR